MILLEDNNYYLQKETPPGFCTMTRVSRTGLPDRPAPFSKLVLLPCFQGSLLISKLEFFIKADFRGSGFL